MDRLFQDMSNQDVIQCLRLHNTAIAEGIARMLETSHCICQHTFVAMAHEQTLQAIATCSKCGYKP